jgi:hypothetical protein
MVKKTDGLRRRNKSLRLVKVADLLDNPVNPRVHEVDQRSALSGAVGDVGWIGYPDVFEHPDHPGKLMLADGHLRKRYLLERGIEEVQVNVTDLTPDEARYVMAAKDSIATMAKLDAATLNQCLEGIKTSSPAVEALFDRMRQLAAEPPPVIPFEDINPEAYADLDKQIETLTGVEDVTITMIVPAKFAEAVNEYLRNGEEDTNWGRGRGTLKRCGLP